MYNATMRADARPVHIHSERHVALSDGSVIDVRRATVLTCAILQAYGKQAQSVSDFLRNDMLDRLFGEDDHPVSDQEIVEGAADLIRQMKRKKGRLLEELKYTTSDHDKTIREELKTNEQCIQKLSRFMKTKLSQVNREKRAGTHVPGDS